MGRYKLTVSKKGLDDVMYWGLVIHTRILSCCQFFLLPLRYLFDGDGDVTLSEPLPLRFQASQSNFSRLKEVTNGSHFSVCEKSIGMT